VSNRPLVNGAERATPRALVAVFVRRHTEPRPRK